MDYSEAPQGYPHDTIELPADVMTYLMTWCQPHILHGFEWEINCKAETVFELSTQKIFNGFGMSLVYWGTLRMSQFYFVSVNQCGPEG
jgi:hypothetical protein